MDWSNENYVRVYTRETEDDLVLSWEARALWKEMLCKFDRAGFLPLKRGRAGLAALIRWPVEAIERAAPELVADGRVRELETGFFAPNFLEAQEAKSSDKQRKREERERRRAHAASGQDVTKRDATVTIRDGLSGFGGDTEKKSLLLADPSSAPKEALPRARARDPRPPAPAPARTPAPEARTGPLPPEPLGTRAAEPVPSTKLVAIAGVSPERSRLNTEAWNYAATSHAMLREEGIAGDVPFPLLAYGDPMRELAARVRELLGDDIEPDYEGARAKLRHRVDVAIAEARRSDVQHLKWFTPSRLWDAKSFARALEVSPAEAGRSRVGPRRLTESQTPEPEIRRLKTL